MELPNRRFDDLGPGEVERCVLAPFELSGRDFPVLINGLSDRRVVLCIAVSHDVVPVTPGIDPVEPAGAVLGRGSDADAVEDLELRQSLRWGIEALLVALALGLNLGLDVLDLGSPVCLYSLGHQPGGVYHDPAGVDREVHDDPVEPQVERLDRDVVEVDSPEDERLQLPVRVLPSGSVLSGEQTRAVVVRIIGRSVVRQLALPALQPVVVRELGLVVEVGQVLSCVVERAKVVELLVFRHPVEGALDRGHGPVVHRLHQDRRVVDRRQDHPAELLGEVFVAAAPVDLCVQQAVCDVDRRRVVPVRLVVGRVVPRPVAEPVDGSFEEPRPLLLWVAAPLGAVGRGDDVVVLDELGREEP